MQFSRPGRGSVPSSMADQATSGALPAWRAMTSVLVQLAGEQGDAVHTRLFLEPVASHAALAAPGLHQHFLVEERPLLSWEPHSIDWPCWARAIGLHPLQVAWISPRPSSGVVPRPLLA